jgi:hypothetical protein
MVVDHSENESAGANASPDLLTTWPVDEHRYGLVAVFEGGSGYERARSHRIRLEREGVPQRLRRERDGTWTLSFGPVAVPEISSALGAFEVAGGERARQLRLAG